MKILAIHNVGRDSPTSGAPVHIWRIYRPLMELAKHVDWEIEHEHQLVESLTDASKEGNFTNQELEVAGQRLSQYDIIFLSYSTLSAAAYTFLLAVQKRYGTRFVIDVDDDVYSVNPDNPIWLTISHERMWDLQTILNDAPWVTTTTDRLAHELRNRRGDKLMGSVAVLPNFISADYQHPVINHENKVVIGYFGGSSHWADLNDTGFRKAMRDIMKKYKHVHFRAAGVPLDIPMPANRESFIDGVRGLDWATKAFPTLDMDIAVAPLENNKFNWSKSNIKWQEATRMGAAFVASRVGPYADLHSDVAWIVDHNTRAGWYNALEELVTTPDIRQFLVENAQSELATNWRLEDQWPVYRDFFERVMADVIT